MKKRVGVTGATGFIGKLLVQSLITNGYDVTVFVRSKTPFSTNVNVIVGDFSDVEAIDAFLQSVDSVVHLVARQVPPEDLFFEENVSITNALIDRMVHFKINQLIYLSTVAVYGDRDDSIHSENENCYPTTKYGETKYLAEQLCHYWKSRTHKKLTILRPFNVYGQGSTKGVIYNMIHNIRNNKPIILFGDGNQKRDFLYVDDIVKAILLSLKKENDGIFNLGTGESISLQEIIAYLKKWSPKTVTVNVKPSEKEKPKNIFYSTANAQEKLGWKFSISIEEGLKKLL